MIRPCTPADVGVICDVINAGASAYEGVIPDDCWHTPYMPLEELQSEIEAGVEFVGFEQDGALLGVMGSQDVQDVTLIRHAYVRPEHQAQGIGSALLTHLMSGAERPVLVGTWADAEWAVRFYQRHGFALTSPRTTRKLLERYWTVPERQMEVSVVLVSSEKGLGRALAEP